MYINYTSKKDYHYLTNPLVDILSVLSPLGVISSKITDSKDMKNFLEKKYILICIYYY